MKRILLALLFCICAPTVYSQVQRLVSTNFSGLGAPPNGYVRYCLNCQKTNPCVSGGTGAVAMRVAGAWDCSAGGGAGVPVSDGDKGDITVSASGATWTLDTGLNANKIGGGGVSTTEFDFLSTLASNAQTQLDAKAPLASPTFTGVPLAPTAAAATNTTQIATTAHVFAERSNAFSLTTKTIDGDLNTVLDLPASTVFKAGTTIPAANILTVVNSRCVRINGSGVLEAHSGDCGSGGGGGDALVANPLSQFAATTSAQVATTVTNETGSSAGLLVFNDSPVIVTPTIASFANATHGHTNAAGGGALDVAAITSGVFAKARQHASTVYNDAGNTFSTGIQSFIAADLLLPRRAAVPGTPAAAQIYQNTSDEKFYACKDASTCGELLVAGLSGTISVSLGGTGATTLTGLLQGNGTSAFTAITNSTTVGQTLRVTGSNAYGWGALDLADTDAVTGVLPDGNISAVVARLASPTFTGTVTIPTPFTLGAVSVLPTGTELNFVDGVTSAIQTQLNAKAPLASPTFTTSAGLTQNQNAGTTFTVLNTTSGTGAYANFALTAGALTGQSYMFSAGYTGVAAWTGRYVMASDGDALGIVINARDVGTGIDFITGATGGTARWNIGGTGHFTAPVDNTLDIGASGATRPRTGYFGTSVVTPSLTVAGAAITNNIVQNSQSTAYTTVLSDAGKHIYHPSADTTARIWTIDSNANVAYAIGTAITFVNDCSAGVLTISITSDTLVLAGAGTTGSRTLAACGVATAIKVSATRWIINGTGLT